MEGSIFKKGTKYAVRFDKGKTKEGRRMQGFKGGFKTKKEAREFLNKVLSELNEGKYVEPSQIPFSEYIIEWFNGSYKNSVEDTTAETRWYTVKNHLIPYFNNTSINSITTKMLDDFYNDKLDEDLQPKTIREFHNLLRRAFTQAVKWGYLKQNPALDATPPKIKRKEVNPWTEEQTNRFLDVVKEVEEEMIYETFIFTGIRRGEMLALKWSDIDFEKAKIRISHSLARTVKKGIFLKDVKTKSSRRQISISSYLVEKLLLYKEKQEKHKEMLGAAYNDLDMVFCAYDGNFKDSRNLLREFHRYIKKSGVPKITLHDLRHLHATLLLIYGENPKIVAERLGHADVTTTLDIYSHVNPDLQQQAADRFERGFFKQA
ncbi:tyrosine-type recombinase/integrase [Mesobacillus thioparans]|uniref:site-specific integrase n=1 Tax=Mesobacillus thioparans TaxID=370439 RepID=UPI0039EE82CC